MFDFDIQLFADGGESTPEGQAEGQTTEANETQENVETKPEPKPEIDIDKKIADALSKVQKNFEETLKKRDAAAKKEAERLAKLSEEDRQKAEIENSMKELEEKEKELQRKELMIEMTKVLAERKIPVQFMDYLIAEDSESTLDRIKTFEKEFKKAVEESVNEKLKGKVPPSSTGNKNLSSGNNAPRSKDDIMKIIADNQVKRG